MAAPYSSTAAIPKLQGQDLVGKVAVVTGASRGIGRAIALDIATRGGSVLATYSAPSSTSHITSLSEIVSNLYAEANTTGPKVVGVVANILSIDCASAIVEALERHFGGKLDILVNNAAVMEIQPVGSITVDHCQRMLLGNIQTPVMLVEALVNREMFRPHSRIVNISSDGARRPRKSGGVYSATKAALEGLTRGWADNLGTRPFMFGTTVNAVCVGLTNSDALKGLPEEALQAVLDSDLPTVSVGPRIAECEDIADVVGFLVSEKSRWVSGSVSCATGGAVKIL